MVFRYGWVVGRRAGHINVSKRHIEAVYDFKPVFAAMRVHNAYLLEVDEIAVEAQHERPAQL